MPLSTNQLAFVLGLMGVCFVAMFLWSIVPHGWREVDGLLFAVFEGAAATLPILSVLGGLTLVSKVSHGAADWLSVPLNVGLAVLMTLLVVAIALFSDAGGWLTFFVPVLFVAHLVLVNLPLLVYATVLRVASSGAA